MDKPFIRWRLPMTRLDEAEARALAIRVLEPLRVLDYDVLVRRYLGNIESFEVATDRGEVGVEVQAHWQDESSGVLNVMACVDAGWRFFRLFVVNYCEVFAVTPMGDVADYGTDELA